MPSLKDIRRRITSVQKTQQITRAMRMVAGAKLRRAQSRIEAARMLVWKACWLLDHREDYRQASSLAKYLAVEIAKDAAAWSADLFGAAAVVFDHPVHQFPMDAWAASLGEGTQDVQKLVIFRELMKGRR